MNQASHLKKHEIETARKIKLLKLENSILQFVKCFRELKDREIKIRKQLEELSTKPTPLPRPKKISHEKLFLLTRPTTLTHTPINISSAET